MLEIGWFSTGRDAAAYDLLKVVLESISAGDIRCRVGFAFCNRDRGESLASDRFLDLVRSHNIPEVSFSSAKFRASRDKSALFADNSTAWRLNYDREVIARLSGFNPNICVMAGYMLIMSPELCHHYQFVNLHPAIPGGPTGTWQEVIWKLIEMKADRAGAMMHLVTLELDRGPAASFCSFPIRGQSYDGAWRELNDRALADIKKVEGENNRLFRLIRRDELAREFPLIVTTLKWFGEGRIAFRRGNLVDSHGNPVGAYDLSRDIDEAILRAE